MRTKRFALRIIKLTSALPTSAAARVIGNQLLRSGTSVGAQYRESLRSRSKAEFISKIESSCQELEETRYWIELLIESGLVPAAKLQPLLDEASELIAIFVTIGRTARKPPGGE